MSALALPALVLWCDPDKLCVECPYCGSLNVHTNVDQDPRCCNGQPYYPYLPPDSYEIDKVKVQFVWSGYYEIFKPDLLDELISKCLVGDVVFVSEYLAKSKPGSCWAYSHRVQRQRKLFIEGTDANGDTVLARLAGRKSAPAMIALLIDNGSDVNGRNIHGRTPLMEAADETLDENFIELLRCGANANLRDFNGRTAIDLAKSATNSSRVNTLTALVQALSISIQPARTKYFCRRNSMLVDLRMETSGVNVAATFDLSQVSTKTVARLDRGSSFAPVDSWSGWKDESNIPTVTTISREEWTERVFGISKLVNHTIRIEAKYDKGEPGRFYACHAEKQLIAYFVSKHVFEWESSKLVTLLESRWGNLLCNSTRACLRRGTITVSKPICEDCQKFCIKVNAKWGLSIVVEYNMRVPSILNANVDDGGDNNGDSVIDSGGFQQHRGVPNDGEIECHMQKLNIQN